MQKLGLEIIALVKKSRMKKMEFELRRETVGEIIECPSCHYVTKKKRFTGKIFESDGKKSFKCFACGIWRAL